MFLSPAHAQFFSARGVTQKTSVDLCRNSALPLQQRVFVLKKNIDVILSCNRQGQLFDSASSGCVDPKPTLSPDHTFAFRATGSTLSLKNPDSSQGTAAIVGGRDGSNVICRPVRNDCNAPWGQRVPDGFGVVAYQDEGVPFGEKCVSEARRCNDGSLGGSFQFQNCSVGAPPPPRACTAPWGAVVSNGTSVTAYEASNVAFGEKCASEDRRCNDGTLSGSFQFKGCIEIPPGECPLPWGGTIAHEGIVTAYQTVSVPFGQTCASEDRRCDNGNLGGSFLNKTCTVEPPNACTLPWGGTISSGQSVTAYQASSVPCGSSCASQTRTCSNGSLSGTYTNSSCSVAACGCNLPWGGTIQDGQSVTAFKDSRPPYGGYCASETRACANGTLSGNFTKKFCNNETCTYRGITWPARSTQTFSGELGTRRGGTWYCCEQDISIRISPPPTQHCP